MRGLPRVVAAEEGGSKSELRSRPHVERFNERIRIDGLEVESQRILTALERVEDHRLKQPANLLRLRHALRAPPIFREESVDVSVLEVGLGGRLDAVNAVDADLAVITNIGLDHQGVLGTSRSEIGTEKAGVVRPGIPVVLGAADMPTSVVDKAQINECPMYVRGREFDEEAGQSRGLAHPTDARRQQPGNALPGSSTSSEAERNRCNSGSRIVVHFDY